ncbi:MAG: extracellular solute-binding protein [Phycisphaerales bacterium]|nr:extracellular solute-binding protein [Phycisphaerales bacterium]
MDVGGPAGVVAVMALALVAALLGACDRKGNAGAASKSGGRVVVYTSVDRIFAEPVLQAAGKELGMEVVGVYDTEETKSTGLVNRLIARKDNPDGDLFWSGDPMRAALLKSAGVTAAYTPKGAEAIPAAFKDPEAHWTGFSARLRVLLVNTSLVEPGEEPRSILELTEPQWKDRVAIANPLFGTTSFHVAALFEALGDDRARAWLAGLRANGVRVVSSNGEVKRQVAAGTVAAGLTDSDDALEAIKDGQPVRIAETWKASPADPASLGGGELVIPNTVSLIRGSPNPEGAKRVADFLLSPPALRMLAESCGQSPLGGEKITGSIDLGGMKRMPVDYAAIAARLEHLMPELKAWAEGK